MSNKRCEDCYYWDVCPKAEVCEDFTPVTSEAEYASTDELIERGRYEFHDEWNTYIGDNQD